MGLRLGQKFQINIISVTLSERSLPQKENGGVYFKEINENYIRTNNNVRQNYVKFNSEMKNEFTL